MISLRVTSRPIFGITPISRLKNLLFFRLEFNQKLPRQRCGEDDLYSERKYKYGSP
jgi:hypothetical protein